MERDVLFSHSYVCSTTGATKVNRKVAYILKEQIISFIDLKNQNVIIWKIGSASLNIFSWVNQTDYML